MGLFSRSRSKKIVKVEKPAGPSQSSSAAIGSGDKPEQGPSAPAAVPPSDEQMYELEVPPNTKPGSKLKLTIPGMTEKVVITVPEGAEPGRTISFTLPKGKKEVDAKLMEQTKAATRIQAKLRGNSARKLVRAKLDSPTATGGGGATEVELAMTPVAPSVKVDSDGEPVARGPGFFTSLKKSFTSLFSFEGAEEAPTEPEMAVAAELTGVVATAITAWESSDFDTFAAISLPTVTVSLPGASASGMQGVWETRKSEEVEGVLSIDTVMAQLDDDDGQEATVVAIEHSHDTEHGMPLKHSWLRMTLRKVASNGAEASWKIAELIRDPIWPLPTEANAAPEAFRLGEGRTLGGAADAASLSAVALTAWMAGDRPRFETVASPTASFKIKSLEVDATGLDAVWGARDNMRAVGTLLSINTAMVDTDADEGAVAVLAHGHLYDVKGNESSGRPTAHFAFRLTFSSSEAGSLTLTEVLGDVIWMHNSKPYETEGLSFDTPPLQTIYTRALTFIKAWETNAADSIEALTSANVRLEVPRTSIESTSCAEMLEYRDTLGSIGMMTVDSVRVSGSRFECYLHEYGVEANQHGLPRMHAGLKLDFSREYREMKISSMYLDIEYTPAVRNRASTFANAGEEVVLQGEL